MKINTSDYPVEKKVIFATEEQCVYDTPVTKLEMAWNGLAQYYTEKLRSANAAAIKAGEFYRMLAHSSVENETALTVYQLVQQNVLRPYPVAATEERPVCLRAYIAAGVRGILLRRMNELRENIAEERETYDKIKSIDHEIQLEDGCVRIYFSYARYVDFRKLDELSACRLGGLSCTIAYRGIKLACFERKSSSDYRELVNEYFYEQTLVQTYARQGLHVRISSEESAGSDRLCMAVLSELKQGRTIEELHMHIMIGLSRTCLEALLSRYERVAFIDTDSTKLPDGYSATFVVLAGSDVFKVCRRYRSFDIYFNGKLLLFEAKD